MIALLALLAALQAPADFVHEEETELLHFRYVWPAAVEREPLLRARLAREMAIPFAVEDLASVPDRYRADFEVAGDRIRPLPDQ